MSVRYAVRTRKTYPAPVNIQDVSTRSPYYKNLRAERDSDGHASSRRVERD